jgi:hypothetical protein
MTSSEIKADEDNDADQEKNERLLEEEDKDDNVDQE